MRVIRCKRCNQMYEYEGLPPGCCPDCCNKERNEFKSIRELVRDNPGITAPEVSKHMNVPFEKVLKYIKEGSLQIVQTTNNSIKH